MIFVFLNSYMISYKTPSTSVTEPEISFMGKRAAAICRRLSRKMRNHSKVVDQAGTQEEASDDPQNSHCRTNTTITT